MGLIPPDPPKVRLTNLMKVLTSDAVQDPTRVEARVRREVAMRKHTHDKMNAERKLTDEQRREKVETKKVEEEKKGIFGALFKYVDGQACWFLDGTTADCGLVESKYSRTPLTGLKSARTRNR